MMNIKIFSLALIAALFLTLPAQAAPRKYGSMIHNLEATTDPGVDDDTDPGRYTVGSLWVNTSADTVWVCADNTDGAAVWKQVDAAGSGAADITITESPTGVEVDAGGTPDSIAIATETNAGVVDPADQAKINNLPADTTTALSGKQDVLSEGAFVDGDKTKLDGIEDSADVTDATNVNAAGATMNADTSLAGNGYFLDEDNLGSDDATKVPSQQSVKAYVDAQIIGSGSGDVVGPASAVDDRIVTFSGTTGKLVQDSGSVVADFATTTALSGKQDVLSEGAFADGDKTKLDGIAAGAEPNRSLASQAEAEAGTENTKGMTPLRTAEAIAALSGGASEYFPLDADVGMLIDTSAQAVTTSFAPDVDNFHIVKATGSNCSLTLAAPTGTPGTGWVPKLLEITNSCGNVMTVTIDTGDYTVAGLETFTIADGEIGYIKIETLDAGSTWTATGDEDITDRPTITIAGTDYCPVQDNETTDVAAYVPCQDIADLYTDHRSGCDRA